jgi:hypothetical protein
MKEFLEEIATRELKTKVEAATLIGVLMQLPSELRASKLWAETITRAVDVRGDDDPLPSTPGPGLH